MTVALPNAIQHPPTPTHPAGLRSLQDKPRRHCRSVHSAAFTLVEVVLAIGIFGLATVVVLGLLAPMLGQVDEAEIAHSLLDYSSAAENWLRDPVPNSFDNLVTRLTPANATNPVFLYGIALREDSTGQKQTRFFWDQPGGLLSENEALQQSYAGPLVRIAIENQTPPELIGNPPYLKLLLRLRGMPPPAPGASSSSVIEAFEYQSDIHHTLIVINR